MDKGKRSVKEQPQHRVTTVKIYHAQCAKCDMQHPYEMPFSKTSFKDEVKELA